MKVKADYDLCEAHAMCESFAPDVFEVDDDDNLQILQPEVTDENRPRIEQAVAACPMAALSITDD